MHNISIERLRRFHSEARRLHAGLMEVGDRLRRCHERRNDAKLELERFEEALPRVPVRRNGPEVSGPNQQDQLNRQLKALRGSLADAEHVLGAVAAEQESQQENWQLAARLANAGLKFCRDNDVAVPTDIAQGY